MSKANLHHVPPDYSRKQTLTNGERYVTEDLKEREIAILHASERRMTLEYDLFVALRQRLADAALLQGLAAAVAELDVLASLAEVAALYEYPAGGGGQQSTRGTTGAPSGRGAYAGRLCAK